jgi:hypothetical protein
MPFRHRKARAIGQAQPPAAAFARGGRNGARGDPGPTVDLQAVEGGEIRQRIAEQPLLYLRAEDAVKAAAPDEAAFAKPSR